MLCLHYRLLEAPFFPFLCGGAIRCQSSSCSSGDVTVSVEFATK